MKAIRFILTALAMVLCVNIHAKGYEPNTRWPYVFENFEEGKIVFKDKSSVRYKLNIHLWGNKLHYVTGDNHIMESENRDIERIEIGDNAYVYADGKVMKIENEDITASSPYKMNAVASMVKADFDALTEGTGAYGASLNSSAATDLNSLDLGGLNNPELGRMEEEKRTGKTIYVNTEYYLVVDGKAMKATKSVVADFMGKDKAAAYKDFTKKTKINWKSPESLKEVLAFIVKNK